MRSKCGKTDSAFFFIHQYEIAIIHNIDFAEDVINMIYVIFLLSFSIHHHVLLVLF